MKKAYLLLHLAVFLFGFTAILGALIDLNSVHLVWWRVFITSLSFVFLFRIYRKVRLLPMRHILIFLGIGVLVGLHWMTFFGSIKASHASITLVCMATGSLFTSFLEPYIIKTKFQWFDVGMGLLVVPGMALVVNQTEFHHLNGIYLGLTSAFLAAMFATLNKRYIKYADEMSITFLEITGAWIFISALLPFLKGELGTVLAIPSGMDWIYLLILALLCTTFAYVIAVKSLHHLSAFASNLVINMEPVYGILLAVVILRENKELTPGFYLGVALILLVVFSYPFMKKRFAVK